MALQNYDYTNELNQLKEAQKQSAIADLQKTRDQALSDLGAESQRNAASYNAQRSSANTQNRMSAKNFQEYLASTGRANSGLGAQARMQYNNNLNTSINNLNAGEAAANADINRRTTDTHNAYNSGLASANAEIESNYIQNLLSERQKQFEREQAILSQELQQRQADLAERQYQESIRQFNEQMAFNREQLRNSFRSGSGGGKSYSRSSSGSSKSSSKSNNKKVSSSDYNISSVSSPSSFSSKSATKWYVANAQNITSRSKLDSVITKGLKSGKITKKDADRIYKSYGL